MLGSKEINDKSYEYLYVCKERTSLFYMIPQIHKDAQIRQVGLWLWEMVAQW